MTPESESGMKVGEQIARYYTELPEVAGVVLGGSAARGIADPSSDLDLFVFCHDYPSERFRSEVVAGFQGEGWKQHGNKLDHGILRDCFRGVPVIGSISSTYASAAMSLQSKMSCVATTPIATNKACWEDCSTPVHCMTPGLSKNGSRGYPSTRMACNERCSRRIFP